MLKKKRKFEKQNLHTPYVTRISVADWNGAGQ